MKSIVLLKLKVDKAKEINEALKQLKAILESCMLFGRYDAAVMIQGESLEELWQIVSCQLKTIPGVIEAFPCLLEGDNSLKNLPEHLQEFIAVNC